MYAIELFLSSPIEDLVRGIWSDLKKYDITSNMANIKELIPHISIGVYSSELPIEEFLSKFDFINLHQMDVKFDVLGMFPSSGTVFMAPTITSELLESHREFYKEFKEYNSLASDYYLPDKWNPHCTLAIKLDHSSLVKTMDFCLSKFTPMIGKINKIAVVKLEFSDGECISSKTIYSKSLN
jgi:2'-5' RNA ligase